MVNNDNRTLNEVLAEFNSVNEASQDEIDSAAKEFLAYAQKRLKEYDAKYENKFPEELSLSSGDRYFRIVKTGRASRSAYGFIDRKNGDILFASSWKAPAKSAARGNVLNKDSWAKAIDKDGSHLVYLR